MEHAVGAAALYRACGVDGVLVENTHDTPYLRRSVGSEVTACMTRVCAEVKKVIGDLPLGVQVLAGGCGCTRLVLLTMRTPWSGCG